MNNNKKINNFNKLMDFFEVKNDIIERINIYEMIQLWCGLGNITISWYFSKKYKYNNIKNNNLQRKKNECFQNKEAKRPSKEVRI